MPFLTHAFRKYLFFVFPFLASSPLVESLDYLNKDAVAVSGDWKRNSWFGYYHDGGSGWIYHPELEWIYPSSPDGNSSWLYLHEMDWAWTTADFYPWLYFHKLEDWRYFERERRFYDAQTESWEIREVLSEQLAQIESRSEENSIGEEPNPATGSQEETDSNGPRLIYYFLTVISGKGGSASGGGDYLEGTITGLAATPAKGYRFLNWSGDGVADANASATTVTMDQDRNLTANFAILQKVLSLNAGMGGTVTGANTYDHGSEANISAVANTGYQFLNWTGGGVTDANASTTTVTMDQDRNLTANFAIQQKVLSLNAGFGGTVTGANTYDYGSEANISAVANTGYQFLNWTGDQVTDANASTITVT
ncbi:MAG: hypothetical protein CBC00_09275, partial [Verrucomicrobia bacterium TMED40]